LPKVFGIPLALEKAIISKKFGYEAKKKLLGHDLLEILPNFLV
jgi:hypothetical protein